MDAAVLFLTDADRRRMRMGEVSASARSAPRRIRRRDEAAEEAPAEDAPAEDAPDTEEEPGRPSDEKQQTARVAREKARWREEEKRRNHFDLILKQRLGETTQLAAQNGIPQLTVLYQQQREMRIAEAEKEETTTDVQSQLGASAAQIQSMMGQARDQNVSWEYRRSVLSRARLAVADHLAALHQVQDRYYGKFAEYAGKPDMVADLTARTSDIEQRKRFMEEYYDVLQRLAGGDTSTSGLDRISGSGQRIAPEIVRNSSTMRLLARRRRNVWAEIA